MGLWSGRIAVGGGPIAGRDQMMGPEVIVVPKAQCLLNLRATHPPTKRQHQPLDFPGDFLGEFPGDFPALPHSGAPPRMLRCAISVIGGWTAEMCD
jgi:hypothetical protein